MEKKQSNLCLSADVTSSATLLSLADSCGPHIVVLKTHVDILSDFTPGLIPALESLSKKHGFLLFEDRKFADIGSTVTAQYSGGMYRIAEWSHVTNCHLIPGSGVVKGIMQAARGIKGALLGVEQKDGAGEAASFSSGATVAAGAAAESPSSSSSVRGLLLIAEMSSSGALATGSYTDANVSLAESEEFDEFVMGFICQRKLSNKQGLIHMTPGVQMSKEDGATSLDASAAAAAAPSTGPSASSSSSVSSARTGSDSLGQQYSSPSHVIQSQGSDVIIVGRAIVGAAEPEKEAERYRIAGQLLFFFLLHHACTQGGAGALRFGRGQPTQRASSPLAISGACFDLLFSRAHSISLFCEFADSPSLALACPLFCSLLPLCMCCCRMEGVHRQPQIGSLEQTCPSPLAHRAHRAQRLLCSTLLRHRKFAGA